MVGFRVDHPFNSANDMNKLIRFLSFSPVVEIKEVVLCAQCEPVNGVNHEVSRQTTASPCHACDSRYYNGLKALVDSNLEWMTLIKPEHVVYISGPMTGYPDDNKPAFRQMEHALKAKTGCKVLSPAYFEDGLSREFMMTEDIKMVLECTHMVMLTGWSKSKGALCEFNVAQETGKTIYQSKI